MVFPTSNSRSVSQSTAVEREEPSLCFRGWREGEGRLLVLAVGAAHPHIQLVKDFSG